MLFQNGLDSKYQLFPWKPTSHLTYGPLTRKYGLIPAPRWWDYIDVEDVLSFNNQ